MTIEMNKLREIAERNAREMGGVDKQQRDAHHSRVRRRRRCPACNDGPTRIRRTGLQRRGSRAHCRRLPRSDPRPARPVRSASTREGSIVCARQHAPAARLRESGRTRSRATSANAGDQTTTLAKSRMTGSGYSGMWAGRHCAQRRRPGQSLASHDHSRRARRKLACGNFLSNDHAARHQSG
jgi:hypothetical protein